MKKVIVGVSAVLVFGGAVLAQPPAAPKPGPEQKALGYFVGSWTSEGEMNASPLGPGGKMTSSDTCDLFAGGFQVVCRGKGTSPMGSMSSLGILSYSAPDKAYTYYGIDSMGMAESSKGQKAGNTWTFTSTSTMGGQTFQSRYTIVELSPTAYSMKWETSPDGTKWTTLIESKATKAAKAVKPS